MELVIKLGKIAADDVVIVAIIIITNMFWFINSSKLESIISIAVLKVSHTETTLKWVQRD
jgi:hypothetical protein